MNKFIHRFWVSYGLIKIKVSESSTPCIITHFVDLETILTNLEQFRTITEGHFKGLSKYRSKVLRLLYIYALYMCICVCRVCYI